MVMARKRTYPAVGAAEFKARCLELVDRVKETAVEYTVTRHGVPVATLGPVRHTETADFVGSMSGSVLAFDQPMDPVPGTWMAESDD